MRHNAVPKADSNNYTFSCCDLYDILSVFNPMQRLSFSVYTTCLTWIHISCLGLSSETASKTPCNMFKSSAYGAPVNIEIINNYIWKSVRLGPPPYARTVEQNSSQTLPFCQHGQWFYSHLMTPLPQIRRRTQSAELPRWYLLVFL